MAYQADILINVRGFQDLARIQKQLEGTARKIDEVNEAAARMGAPNRTIERFSAQLQLAERSLQKVAIGSVQEQRAISNYVTALNNSNVARDRQNKLIQAEINTRNAATNAIRANVEANIAESQASRAARAEAQQLNAQLIQQERLRRKLAERGLMQLSGGGVAKGVADAGFGVQGPARPPTKAPTGLQAPGVLDAILGGGFPMLFGGGPGAVLGGAAGGFLGGQMGGMAGMALSIGLSAVGQQLDAAVKRVQDLGNALAAIDVDKIRDSFIAVNADLDTTVRRMIEAGQAEQARAAIATEVAAQTDALFNGVERSAEATNRLTTQWSAFTGSVSTLVSLLSGPLINGLTVVVGVLNLAVKGLNTLVSLAGELGKKFPAVAAALDPVNFAFGKIAELMPSINEELEKQKASLVETTDAAHRQLVAAMKLEQIDKNRTHVVTTLGKLINIEADRQSKIVNIRAGAEQKIIDLRLKYGNLTDAQSKKELELAIKQIQVQATLEVREANRAALRQRLVALNEQLIAQDKLAQQITANQAAVEAARSQGKQQVLQAQIQELELQKQFVLSLNQETAINDKIASKKIEAANESYNQAARELKLKVDLAAADLQSVEAAYKRGFATQEQVLAAKSNLDTAVATNNELLKGAEATRTQAVAAADVERRQSNVAAYAADAARQTEAFNRAANEATNTLNNRVKVSDALTQAALTVNNIEIQSLQNKLAQAQTEGERLDILGNIRDLEIANAALTLQATRTQIQAEVERQRIAMSMAEVKYRELQAVVQLAAAQKVLTTSHLEALAAQKSALNIAKDNYATSIKVADAQMQAADAVYNASVNAANLKMNMEGTAAAAGAVAGAMERVAAASSRGQAGGAYLTAENIKNPILRERATAALAEIDKRRSRTGNALQILKTLSDKQAVVLDYMAMEKRARKTQEMQSAAQELESLGLGHLVPDKYKAGDTTALFNRYGSAPSDMGAVSANPQVNITTGPVMQMDGTNYVTQRDLVSATGTAARQGAKMALEMLQKNPASRRSTGVTR